MATLLFNPIPQCETFFEIRLDTFCQARMQGGQRSPLIRYSLLLTHQSLIRYSLLLPRQSYEPVPSIRSSQFPRTLPNPSGSWIQSDREPRTSRLSSIFYNAFLFPSVIPLIPHPLLNIP